MEMQARKPNIVSDGGPWAEHDQACAVRHDIPAKAVYNCNTRVFEPSWNAQSDGWRIVRVRNKFQGWVLRTLGLIVR